MKVLVTGGAGFIGSHIVDTLIQAKHQVCVLDNLSTGAARNINAKASFLKKDIRDTDLIGIFAAERFDYVVHQAAQTMVSTSSENPVYDCDVNVLGLVNLLEASRLSGVKRVVFASSAAIYGDTESLPIDESCNPNPNSFYGLSKLTGERYLEMYYKNFGLEYVALRYANVYGERQGDQGEGGVISIFAKNILSGKPLTVFGNGRQTRDFVYVRDVAAANYQALFSSAANRSFNISTATETSICEIIALFSKINGEKLAVEYGLKRQSDIQRSVLNHHQAKTYLQWQPEYELKTGLHLLLHELHNRISA